MKKILLVSHSQKIGGAERCLYELADGLVRVGFQVSVSIPSRGENFELFNTLNVRVIIISYPWWVYVSSAHFSYIQKARKVFSHFKAIIKLSKIITLVKPDYIISNTVVMPAAAIASKFLGKKHFWFIHELAEEDHGLKFDFGFKFSSKLIAFTANKVLVNSEFVKTKFMKFIPSHKFRIINYNIPAPAITYSEVEPKGGINLYLIGQIQRGKGQLIAIKAHKILIDKGYACQLQIIGAVTEENYYKEILAFILDANLKNVFFHEFTLNPFKGIAKNAIGLMCSEFEALGRVTIEYMKSGIPVIGCNAGATMSLIKNEWNGLLFVKSNPCDLSDKILQLHDNISLTECIVMNAKQYAYKNFNVETYITGVTNALTEKN